MTGFSVTEKAAKIYAVLSLQVMCKTVSFKNPFQRA